MDIESFVGAAATNFAVSHEHPCAMEGNAFIERGEESPGGVLEQLVRGDRGVSEEESGTDANIDDEHIDVVGSALTMVISGFESVGFIFSEIIRRRFLDSYTLNPIGLVIPRALKLEDDLVRMLCFSL